VRAAAERLRCGTSFDVLGRMRPARGNASGSTCVESMHFGYRLTAAGEGGPRVRGPDEASSHRMEERASSGATRVSCAGYAGDDGAAPRDTHAHADSQISRVCIGTSRWNFVVRRADKLTNREADVAIRVVYDRKSLAAQSSRHEGTGAVGGLLTCHAMD